MSKCFIGTLVQATRPSVLEVVEHAVVLVKGGKIVAVEKADSQESASAHKLTKQADEVFELGKRIMMPGFIDLHTHAPQFPNAGAGYELKLLPWLENYTFPVESSYADLNFARDSYSRGVKRYLQNGTTTCVYFATIHLEATKLFAEIVDAAGQRAYIGKVNMDRNCPDTLKEETKDSLANTEAFIKYCTETLKSPNITPIVTPRFVPSTTTELMNGLGELASKYNLPIQSHISENKDEVKWVKELHPDCENYAEVYNKHGLLRAPCILAHACHIIPEEAKLLSEKGVGIAHCANSNFSLTSGAFNIRDAWKMNVKVGLGTDVSGGSSVSIVDAMRNAVIASKTHHFNDPSHEALTPTEALYLATVGGAQVLGRDDIGSLETGKAFDCVVVDPYAAGSPFDVFDRDSIRDIFSKYFYLGDDRNVSQVWVGGSMVSGTDMRK